MSSRATDLFAKLEREQISAIDQLVESKAAEQLFLEFKGAVDSAANTLCDEDSNVLAKAISGFANSQGGIVVWGIDCRKIQGEEKPIRKPIKKLGKFRKKVEESLSRLTIPVHAGIENLEIDNGTGEGFLATYIPPSRFSPIRAITSNKDIYYIRAGDSFLHAPHAVLQGMFGRTPGGVHWIQVLNQTAGIHTLSKAVVIDFRMGLANGGSTLLERPYLALQPGNKYTSSVIRVSAAKDMSSKSSFTGNWQVVASPGEVIVPGGCTDLCTVCLEIEPGRPVDGAIEFEMTFGAVDAVPRREIIECSKESLEIAIAKIRQGEKVSSVELFSLDRITRAARSY